MSPSFNSFGSLPSVSQLVWDTDLIIPEGKVIESASGKVAIAGDVRISGNITKPVYPSTVAGGDNPSVNDTLVLSTTGTTRVPVLWGYKGNVFVTGNGTVTLRGLNMDTGAFTTQSIGVPSIANLNMFVISVEGNNTSFQMQNPKNMII